MTEVAAAPAPEAPPFALRDGERCVTSSPGALIHRLGATAGRLWLTTERVVFRPVIPWALWIIPIFGAAIYAINLPRRRELARADIVARGRTNFGRNPNVLVLTTRDLGPDLKVVVDDFDAFTTALGAPA